MRAYLLRMHHVVGFQPLPQASDRFAPAAQLDLGLVPIKLRIEHRMCAQPIGSTLQKIRLVSFADRMDRPARGRLDRDNIHTVNGFGGDLVGGGLTRDVGLRFRDRERRPHRIKIILADE